MSVLINMEMPKSCSVCPMCGLYSEHKGDVHRCDITFYPVEYEDGLEKRHKDCPLVPVPPHGDLIDRDKIAYFKDDSNLVDFDYAYRSQINSMPAVIPAEEGEK